METEKEQISPQTYGAMQVLQNSTPQNLVCEISRVREKEVNKAKNKKKKRERQQE